MASSSSPQPGGRARADASERLFRWGLGAILLIAAALRAVYLTQTLGDPLLRDLFILDSRTYDRLAGLIASGDLLAGREAFVVGPLYAYFLALLRRLFGEGTGVIYSIQQLLGLGNIALTALLARRCFGVRSALVAAALTALYGAMAMLEVKVMASTLAVFLSLASLWLLLEARQKAWRLAAFVPGWVLGLTCLVRPNTLLFFPVAALWLLWDGRGFRDPGRRLDLARLPATLMLTCGVAVAIAPATLRNYTVADELILISSQSGITFYQSNNEHAQGLYTRLPGFRGTPTDMRRRSRLVAEKDLGFALTESEVSRYWMRKGLRFLLENPIDAIELEWKKLRYWTTSDELSTEYVLPVERDLVPSLWLMPIPFGVIFALAFLGVRKIGYGRPQHVLLYLFVLVNLVSVLIFYFSSRYRLPAVPVLATFAGCGLIAAIDRFRLSRKGFWIWLSPGLILAVYSLHSFSDHLQSQAAQQLYNYGSVYYERGLYQAAVEKYRAALVTFEKRWQLHLDLGKAYQRLGDHEAALREYERVLESRPKHRLAGELAARVRERLAAERR